jgi:glycyl-tRNA synthetase beta subunit
MPVSGEIITIGLAAVAAIVWLIRLEGRLNTTERDLNAANVRTDAEAKAHRATADALIRVEEQLKYVRDLLERHFVIEEPGPRRRRAGGTAS